MRTIKEKKEGDLKEEKKTKKQVSIPVSRYFLSCYIIDCETKNNSFLVHAIIINVHSTLNRVLFKIYWSQVERG